jgi:hypothetical protein
MWRHDPPHHYASAALGRLTLFPKTGAQALLDVWESCGTGVSARRFSMAISASRECFPSSDKRSSIFLSAFLLDKAFYELSYEPNIVLPGRHPLANRDLLGLKSKKTGVRKSSRSLKSCDESFRFLRTTMNTDAQDASFPEGGCKPTKVSNGNQHWPPRADFQPPLTSDLTSDFCRFPSARMVERFILMLGIFRMKVRCGAGIVFCLVIAAGLTDCLCGTSPAKGRVSAVEAGHSSFSDAERLPGSPTSFSRQTCSSQRKRKLRRRQTLSGRRLAAAPVE